MLADISNVSDFFGMLFLEIWTVPWSWIFVRKVGHQNAARGERGYVTICLLARVHGVDFASQGVRARVVGNAYPHNNRQDTTAAAAAGGIVAGDLSFRTLTTPSDKIYIYIYMYGALGPGTAVISRSRETRDPSFFLQAVKIKTAGRLVTLEYC